MPRLGRAYPVQRIWTPPRKLAGPAAFDAVGAGSSSNDTVSHPSWLHNAAMGAYVLVYIELLAFTSVISSVTYGGTGMTLLSTIGNNNNTGANGYFCAYGLANVAGGSTTVTVNLTAPHYASCCSVSYTNVSSAGTAATVFGSSSSSSQSVTCSAGQMISQAFGVSNTSSGAYFTGASGGTNRYNDSGGTDITGLVISDATANTTFSATPNISTTWSGIAFVL